MIEKALSGSRNYQIWIVILLTIIGAGVGLFVYQTIEGLGVTGMGRDITWGIYISQFTFLVGVAAAAVMVVLPYYLHNYKQFGPITVFGEFMAVGTVVMCQLFIFVDMGQPMRVLNVILHPTFNSVMFWDMTVLCGYLGLNLVIGWIMLSSEHKDTEPPKWIKPFVYLSIPWAVSIHTVTAFLYSGLPGRHYWLTAILAPRFLASAFAAGPALLIILLLIVRKVSKFDPGKEAIQTLAKIVTYAMILNVFFMLLEVFTAFYSNIPGHMHALEYLFVGLHGKSALVPFMWFAAILAFGGIFFMLFPSIRANEKYLAILCGVIFMACWIDKGLGLILGGFVPTPLHDVVEYTPTFVELMISLSIYAIGALIVTLLYKIAIGVKEERIYD